MDPKQKPSKVRFISGRPEVVDAVVNEMLDEYGIASINFATTEAGVIVTLYLIHSSVIGQMQIANGVAQVRGGR